MTAEPLNNAAGLDAPAGGRLWRDEMRATVKLALPIALTQLGQVAMMTSDLILIGRLGDVAIAGAALAHIILFACFVLGMGLMSAVSPLAAQAYGAREPRIFGQEAIARMNRICAGLHRSVDNAIDIQIALARGSRAQHNNSVRHQRRQRVAVSFGNTDHRRDPHASGSAYDA